MKTCLLNLLFCLSLSVSNDSWATPKVMASIKPLALIAQDLLGELAQVDVLLAPNADPHHYALTISDRQRLEHADLILWLGPEFEQFLVKPLANLNQNQTLAAINPNLLENKALQLVDPHIWLDPNQGMAIMQTLADGIIRQFPGLKEPVSERLAKRIGALAQLRDELRRELLPYGGRSFIADHPAYRALVEAYELRQVGAIQQQEDIGPSARHMAELSAKVEQQKPSCVLAREGQQRNRSVQRWTQRWQLPLVTVDILGTNPDINTYEELLAQAAQAIHRCFNP